MKAKNHSSIQLSNLVDKTLTGLSPIQTIMKMTEERNIRNLGLDPKHVISFGGGWCNHQAPITLQKIYQSICQDIKAFHHSGRYSPILGDYHCRRQLARYEHTIYQMKSIAAENICLGHSSTQLFHDLLRVLTNPGEGICVLDPTYANYINAIKSALPTSPLHFIPALNSITWKYLQDSEKSLETIKQRFTDNARILVIPVPDNPTSQIPPDTFLQQCYDIIADAKGFLILDFAYKPLWFDTMPLCFSWSSENKPHLIALHSNSKWLSSLGRRFGWIEATPAVIAGMEKINESTLLSPDTLHSMATAQFLESTLPHNQLLRYINEIRGLYKETAQVLIQSIKKHLGWNYLHPQGGLYTCCPTPNNQSSLTFSEQVLKNTGVLVIPGHGFGPSMENAVRFSYGPLCYDHDLIKEGVERIAGYC